MVWRVAIAECTRSVRRMRFWGLILLTALYGALAARAETEAIARGAGIAPGWQLAAATSARVLWLVALALPLVAGANLARDRSTGYLLLQRARGASGGTIAAGRLAAAALVAQLAVAAALSALVCAGMVAVPTAASVGGAVGFEPRLLDSSPGAWLGLVGIIQALAATVVLAGSQLAGWLIASPRGAEIGPPLIVLGLGFAVVGPLSSLNPLERLSFLDLHGVSRTAPEQMLIYWGTGLVGLCALALLVSRRRNGV